MEQKQESFYTKNIAKQRNVLFVSLSTPNITHICFMNMLGECIKEYDKVLDIGTGNGYILSEIYKQFSSLKLSLTGIDNSIAMLNCALNVPGVTYKCCDNNNTMFQDETFNIITAKNVTRFNAHELYRILQNGGFFVMREYAECKGLVEVARLFKHRLIRSRSVSFYENLLKDAGFCIYQIKKLRFSRTFKDVAELIYTIKSYPFIENFSQEDEELIKTKFSKHLTITADPFVLIAKKTKAKNK